MTSTNIDPFFLGGREVNNLDPTKTFHQMNKSCYEDSPVVRAVCVVKPNIVRSETTVRRENATTAAPQTDSVEKLPAKRNKLNVVELTAKASSRDPLERTKRNIKWKKRRTTLVRAAGITAWIVASPIMILLLVVRTPSVDEEDDYDDPLLPWKYGRRPPPRSVK